jgi:hypothetical protein
MKTHPTPLSLITEMKEFTMLRSTDEEDSALQIFVSDVVFHAVLTAEISFRLYREKTLNFDSVDVQQYFVDNLMYVWEGSDIPNCHDLGRKILKTFIGGRLKEFGKTRRETTKAQTVEMSSKSVAMRSVADQITVNIAQPRRQD